MGTRSLPSKTRIASDPATVRGSGDRSRCSKCAAALLCSTRLVWGAMFCQACETWHLMTPVPGDPSGPGTQAVVEDLRRDFRNGLLTSIETIYALQITRGLVAVNNVGACCREMLYGGGTGRRIPLFRAPVCPSCCDEGGVGGVGGAGREGG